MRRWAGGVLTVTMMLSGSFMGVQQAQAHGGGSESYSLVRQARQN